MAGPGAQGQSLNSAVDPEHREASKSENDTATRYADDGHECDRGAVAAAYVKKDSSERVVISTELGRQRSRSQSRFCTDMGTICKRLSEGDDFLGLFDLALVAERRAFWMKHANRANIIDGFNYAGSAVDFIRILDGNTDIDVELRNFVQDVFVYTMELLWVYRHNIDAVKLPKPQYNQNTKKLGQHFKDLVKKDEFKSKPGYRHVPVMANFPSPTRQQREIAHESDDPVLFGFDTGVKVVESDG